MHHKRNENKGIARKNKIPNGFLENWNKTKCSVSKSSLRPRESDALVPPEPANGFNPASIILSTVDNTLLTKENDYEIRFSAAAIKGDGIDVNKDGNILSIDNDGDYRCEIAGEATPYSDVNAKLIYYSPNFNSELSIFTETDIPKNGNQLSLRGIPTILPITGKQNIKVKIVPDSDESIVLSAGTRLIIHRVA